ncbi:ABC transporter ATP-binding protein [Candidatus Halocynthiibacter alkanivorans]|uniref:ABC transporter ATP-binding protein n=1 Tax=Candidatus Halocynthiibacter alkanivorans TaxID=2267619 RepID=UPI000DF29F25|nr:ABC transporter ATP-binding protein [Candidatus Halocynthiibacter alkanivorans]
MKNRKPTRKKIERKPYFSAQDAANIRWFWNTYLKQKTPWLLLVLGMILIQGLVYQQFLALTESGLRVIYEDGNLRKLVEVCLLVFFLFTVRGAMSYLVPRLSVWLASDAVLKMRQDLIDHLLTLDLEYFERTPPGAIILRLVNQAQDVSVFVGHATVNALRDTATVVIISGYLIYKSPILFLTAVVVFPLIILMMQKVSHRIKAIQAEAENAMGAYMNGIEEMANGMRTVKISGQEPQERRRLSASNEEIKDLSIRLQSAQALVVPFIDLVSAFIYVLVIGGGGYMVISPDFELDSAAIIAFLLGMVLVFAPMRSVAQFLTRLQANLVLLESICSLYREQPSIYDAPDAVSTFDTAGDIVLENVAFRYNGDNPLFSDLNMTFKGGRVTAIVGATGSGKTTVLSLLTRLYPVRDGQISIGGQPITGLSVASLRAGFSVVAQDIVIFNSSIWENIRYVRPDASDEEIWQAAEAAEIADLIRQRGDAALGPKGSQLSGGQKQRIAIARAFLRSAPILLLDEATSALDQKTEDKVKRALKRLSKDKTTLVVAHRLSAVVDADLIYVMDNGCIIESGTHAELMLNKGLYASMYVSQKESYS